MGLFGTVGDSLLFNSMLNNVLNPIGGYGTVEGAKHNPWIQFIKAHRGQGYTLKQLSQVYRSQKRKYRRR
jgi:hypothetical protein